MALSSTSPKTSSSAVARVVAMIENAPGPVALDLETTGLHPRKGTIRLVQVSNGVETYVVDAARVDPRPVFEALAAKPVLCHNAAFEWGWIYHHHGIELGRVGDTMLMRQLTACGNAPSPPALSQVAEVVFGGEAKLV